MNRRMLAVGAALVGLLAFAGTAGATTLGMTGPPVAAATVACHGVLIGQLGSDATTPYVIPANGGRITQWQTYSAGDTPGSSLTLVVVRPAGPVGSYIVDALDTETLPNPLPANDVASFTPASPIQVAAGDTLMLYSAASNMCYFTAGTTPSADTMFQGTASLPLSAGEGVTGSGGCGGGCALNVAVTLLQPQDGSVQASAFPSATNVSDVAALSSNVTNGGPVVSPITFVDQVPAGLRIQSAAAGLGACTISGQIVTCVITGLAVGQSAPIVIVVTATAAGSYTNDVSVATASGFYDPVTINNTASSTLAVTAPTPSVTTPTPSVATPTPVRQCIVPKLPRLPFATARNLLQQLGCTVRSSTKHSKVAKGLVIGLVGNTGTFPYQQSVTLIVSSGPKVKKHKHHKKH